MIKGNKLDKNLFYAMNMIVFALVMAIIYCTPEFTIDISKEPNKLKPSLNKFRVPKDKYTVIDNLGEEKANGAKKSHIFLVKVDIDSGEEKLLVVRAYQKTIYLNKKVFNLELNEFDIKEDLYGCASDITDYMKTKAVNKARVMELDLYEYELTDNDITYDMYVFYRVICIIILIPAVAILVKQYNKLLAGGTKDGKSSEN